MSIKQTTNYKMFRLKKGNREIQPGHVKRLIDSIQKNNMLSVNPVIINDKNEVIDGQHRIMAAQSLKLAIPYVVFTPASLSEIQILNANQKNWSSMDYLKSYVIQGKSEYKKFKTFWEKYEFPLGAVLELLGKGKSKNQRREFKMGTFKVFDYNKAVEFADEIINMKPFLYPTTFNTPKFYRAVMSLESDKNNFPLWKLTNKLKETGIKIFPAVNRIGYLRQFEDAVNKGHVGKRVVFY